MSHPTSANRAGGLDARAVILGGCGPPCPETTSDFDAYTSPDKSPDKSPDSTQQRHLNWHRDSPPWSSLEAKAAGKRARLAANFTDFLLDHCGLPAPDSSASQSA